MNEKAVTENNPADGTIAKVIYILYLVGIAAGVTSVVGVVMAYIKKSDAPSWLQSHYQFQIRTFWIGILYSIVAVILVMVVIGYFLLLFVVVWLIVRCVKGLQHASNGAAMPNPKTWLF